MRLTKKLNPYSVKEINQTKSDDKQEFSNKKELDLIIRNTQKAMENAAQNLDFLEAIKLRDQLFELKKLKK